MSLYSLKNSTTKPVKANGIFEGQYENVLQYNMALCTIYADRLSQLTVYQSQLGDAVSQSTSTVVPAGTNTTLDISLNTQYFKVTLDNLDGVHDMSTCRLSTIYRPLQTPAPSPFISRQTKAVLNGKYWDGSMGSAMNLVSGESLSVYGHCDADMSLTVMLGPTSSTLYSSQYVYLAPSGDFGFNLGATGAPWMNLKVNAGGSVDVSAYISEL